MKRFFSLFTVLCLMCSPSLAVELKTLSLDDASSVTPRITTDFEIKKEGEASVKIETQWPTTVCLGEVTGLDIENVRVTYTAFVKSDFTGTAYLEMWAHVGGGQYFSRGLNSTISGTADWKPLSTPFLFQKGQVPGKITLNLVINGTGTVWIDGIILSKEPLH